MFRELTTQRLFFLQVKRDIGEGNLRCDKDTTVQLCALALQAQGDYVSTAASKRHIENEKLIPDHTIAEFSHSLEQVASAVNMAYRSLAGTSESSAILGYMTIAQQLRGYGVHHYAVTYESDSLPYYLGIGPHGISMYDHEDLGTPRQSWRWLALENVSWKKQRFELKLVDDDGYSTSVHVWKTESAYQSEQMLKMVLFQHTSSLTYERTKAARRLGASDPRVEALAGNRAASPQSPHCAPAAVEVRLPSDATQLHRLVSVSATNAAVSPSIRTFATTSSGGVADKSDLSQLHRLERRRDQLKNELKWHRELLSQCSSELEQHMPSIRTSMRDTFRRVGHEAGRKSAVATMFQQGGDAATARRESEDKEEAKQSPSQSHATPLHPEGLVMAKEHARKPQPPHSHPHAAVAKAATAQHGRVDTPRPHGDPVQHHLEHDPAAWEQRTRDQQHHAPVHGTGKVLTKAMAPPPPGAIARHRRGTPMPGTMAASAAAALNATEDNGGEDEDDVPLAPTAPHALEQSPPGWFQQSKRRESAGLDTPTTAAARPQSSLRNGGHPRLDSLDEHQSGDATEAARASEPAQVPSAQRHTSMSQPKEKAWV
jgi:hypothetical protein